MTIGVPASAVTTTQLSAKALSLANMPTAWSAHTSANSAATSTRCLTSLKSHFPHEVNVSVLFEDGNLPALEESLQTGPGVDARYDKLHKDLTSCRTFSFTAGGQTIHGAARGMSFPGFGTRSAAFAFAFTDQGIKVGADVVLFKVGSIIGEVLFEEIGTPNVRQLQAFMTEAVNKILGKLTITPVF
jgi:hypothetical protein